ncbi:MAG: hypothetical protein K8S00_11215 [Bacteroidales bacterium]|nr:hypothetical protein [Bacteroidales bacterium]
MKRTYLLIIVIILAFSINVNAQNTKVYSTSSGEMIFSFADLNMAGNEKGNVMRFSPAFNFQNLVNFDFSDRFGIYSGINIRNVGFIYENSEYKIKKKYRTYNAGIPIGIKLGNLNKMFVFGGYELEMPFNYKEKTFINESKEDKFNVWFSDRVHLWNSAVFGGIHFPYGTTITFKYYLTNFFNKDFEEVIDGQVTKPFKDFDVNVFYISVSFQMFRNSNFSPDDYFDK